MNTQQNAKNCTVELLEALNKNLGTGKNFIIEIMSKVKDREMREDLTKHLDKYSELAERAESMLCRLGRSAKPQSAISKMGAKLELEMSTLTDSSTERIAQLIIEGTTMGITNNIGLVRDYENTSCSEEALSLARAVVSYQEKVVEKSKKYL